MSGSRTLLGLGLVLAAGLAAWWCKDPNDRVLGDWRVHLEYPKTDQEPGGPKPWVFASTVVTFKPGGRFELRTAGIPSEGRFTLEDSRLQLEVETMCGLSLKEFEKLVSGTETSPKSLTGKISQDGSRIEIGPEDKSTPPMLLIRDPFNVPAFGEAAVSDAERGWVGTYRSRATRNDPKVKVVLSFWTLELRSDKTFVFRWLYDQFGTWRAEGSTLTLRTTNLNGWTEADSSNLMKLTRSGEALALDGGVDWELKKESR